MKETTSLKKLIGQFFKKKLFIKIIKIHAENILSFTIICTGGIHIRPRKKLQVVY